MANFIHSKSPKVSVVELETIFDLPGTQTSIERARWERYLPKNSLTDNGPTEFFVSGSGDDFFDPATIMHFIKLKIEHEDGTPLTYDEEKKVQSDVGPTESWFYSLYEDVIVEMNHNKVSSNSGCQPFRCNIEIRLGFGPAAKKSKLGSVGYYKDTAGFMNNRNGKNKGFSARQELTRGSSELEMFGPLYCDVFNVDRYMLNEVSMSIKFIHSKPSFNLMGDKDKYRVKILNSALFVRWLKVSPSDLLKIHSQLSTDTAKYPFTRTEVKTFSISIGHQTHVEDNLFIGQQPKRVVIAFVENSAYAGTITENPFNYQNFGITRLVLYSGGQQIPATPLEPNFDNPGCTIMSYNTLFSGSGTHFGDEGNDITRDDYNDGYTFWCFDLTPDGSAGCGSHWNQVKLGNFRIDITFKEHTKKAITGLVYAEFDALLQVDLRRNITLSSS